MKHVLAAVVSRFVTLYGEPRTDNHEALYSEYVRALKDFDQEALELAVDEVVKQHTFPTWPMPGEVYKQALVEAAKLHAKRPKPTRDPELSEPRPDGRYELTEEQKAHNRRMIEELKRSVTVYEPQRVNLPAPTRTVMEELQAKAMRTADGRMRHLRGWYPGMEAKPDEAAE
jgi:hypothetical protein